MFNFLLPVWGFIKSSGIKYLAIGGAIAALVVVPYCHGKRVGNQNCVERGLKDALEREDEFNKVREKRDEEYKKITDNLGSPDDKFKSDLLSKRPYSH